MRAGNLSPNCRHRIGTLSYGGGMWSFGDVLIMSYLVALFIGGNVLLLAGYTGLGAVTLAAGLGNALLVMWGNRRS